MLAAWDIGLFSIVSFIAYYVGYATLTYDLYNNPELILLNEMSSV